MIISPQGFWLYGKPQEILQQLSQLRTDCYYVQDLLEKQLSSVNGPLPGYYIANRRGG